MKTRPNSPSATPVSSRTEDRGKTLIAPLMVCLGFFSVHAVAVLTRPHDSFQYDYLSRIWGIDNIGYYSVPAVIAFYAILVLICFPSVNRKLVNAIRHLATAADERAILSTTTRKVVGVILLGVIFLALSRIFHIKYNFLGDMDIRVHQTVNQQYQTTEFTTMWGLHQVYDKLHLWFGTSGMQVFQWSSALFGVLFVWIAFFLASQLGKDSIQKLLVFLFAVAIGTMQLFFGYAEIYPFPALTAFLFVYTGVLYTKDKVSFIVPLSAFVVAVSAHWLSIVFLPSIVFLFGYRRPWILEKIRIANMRHLILLILITIPAAYVILPLLHQGYYIMPWSRPVDSPNTTTLLSPEHIWEFFNSQLLATGGGLFLVIVVVLRMLKSKQSMDSTGWFLALAASFSLLGAFITNTVRGSGDWDILAFPAIVCNVWAVTMYLSQAQSKFEIFRTHGVLSVLLVFNILNTATWIGINASDKSIAKIRDMLIGDPGNYYQQTLPVPLSLAFNYETNGLEEEALKYFKISTERDPQDPRSFYNYATRLLHTNQDSLAATYLEYLAANFPTYSPTYETLISVYAQKKDHRALFRVIERLFGYYVQNPAYFQSVIPTANLANWFSYLLQVESENKNEKAVQMIRQQIAQLR